MKSRLALFDTKQPHMVGRHAVSPASAPAWAVAADSGDSPARKRQQTGKQHRCQQHPSSVNPASNPDTSAMPALAPTPPKCQNGPIWFYMSADNNLSSTALKDVNEMENRLQRRRERGGASRFQQE